jgi:ketosteroid isomerase-like protein
MTTINSSTSDEATDAHAIDLARAEEAFNQAMISNDVTRISACISSDWVLVTPEVGVVPRARILHAIESGDLEHNTMTKDICRVRVYGDFAIVTARGRNTGYFKGQPIRADEWVTDVYRKVNGQWLCVLTHLTPVAT